ncbi:PWWP domain-containing protein 2A [Diretmus argenteus]
MAAVAAEPGAAAVPTTTTASTDVEGPLEPGPVESLHPGTDLETYMTREHTPVTEQVAPRLQDGDGEERRHVRPELEPAAGKALAARGEDENAALSTDDEVVFKAPVTGDRVTMDRLSPGLGEPEVYRSILTDSQPSVVFLHSFPVQPPATEAGLSLAEPAEPTTNVTTADRSYTKLRPEPAEKAARTYQDAAEDAILDGTVDRLSVSNSPDVEPGYGKNCVDTEQLPVARTLRDSSCRSPHRRLAEQEKMGESTTEPGSPEPGRGAASPVSVEQLSPGSEVRVCLDHVIDDALVVSFRVGERVFSGVLMDLSKRFGPYGIPITVFPRRDYRDRPQPSMQLQQEADDSQTMKQEVVTINPPSPPHPWTSKPPPLFQEGAPYPPPLFIRDTYNQALPQPMPRKIKRPKRRYRCEEPTSIMNSIKLRPRQVLCDKCKGVVTAGGPREARRASVASSEPRGEETSRRRRPVDGGNSSVVKRLRSDREEKGGRGTAERRPSSGIRVPSSSSSSRRVLRAVSSSSSSSSSSRVRLKLNSKKVLAKASGVDRSQARQVLKKLARSSQPPPQNRQPRDQNQDPPKAVTRAAALQSHNQKVHFTRRLQHLSAAPVIGSSPHTALPPRMRLKPQRYRTDDSQAPCSSSSSSSPPKQSTRSALLKPALSPTPTPESALPPSQAPSPSTAVAPPCPLMPSSSGVGSVAIEKQEVPSPPIWEEEEEGENRGMGRGGEGGEPRPAEPPSQQQVNSCSSSLDPDGLKSSHSECSSTETFDLPPPGDLLQSSSSTPLPLLARPPLPAPLTSIAPRCTSTSVFSNTPTPPKAEAQEEQGEDEGVEVEEGVGGGEPKRRRKSSSSSSSMFSKSVSKCSAPDGRTVCVGDIVWAKIYGFPWWPARVLGITVSRRGDTGLAVQQEARVSWFGSPTTSFLPLAQLSPFLESFQSRFDRKRKGPYRRAIAEAASAAKQLTPEVRALLTQFET